MQRETSSSSSRSRKSRECRRQLVGALPPLAAAHVERSCTDERSGLKRRTGRHHLDRMLEDARALVETSAHEPVLPLARRSRVSVSMSAFSTAQASAA